MVRCLLSVAIAVAVVVGLSACSSPPPCHHPAPCCPVESAWVCPVDGSIDTQPGLCPHCGAVRVQKSVGTQASTETSYDVK